MADGSIVIDTKLDSTGLRKGLEKLQSTAKAGLTALGGIVTGFAGYAIKAGSDFEAAMSEVQAVSGATAEEMMLLTEKAKEMGASTKFSASESAAALNYMAMAGWKTEDMLGGLEGIMNLAAASGEDLATVSDIVTDALTAFGLQASDSARFADVLAKASSNSNTNVYMMGETFKYVAPLAGAMGYSIEDAAVAIGLMANAGIKGSEAGTALRATLTRLVKPPKDAADAMEKLGITVTSADGSMKPLRQTMQDLREAFAGLTAEEQAAMAASIAGQEAMSGLLAIVNASPADFEKLTMAIDDANGAAAEMAAIMNDNLQGSVTIFKSALEGIGITLYDSMEAPLRNIVSTATGYLNELNVALEKWGAGGFLAAWSNILGEMMNSLADSAPEMIAGATELLQTFLVTLDGNSDKIAKAGVQIVVALAKAAVETLPQLAEVGLKIMVSLAGYILDNLPKLVEVAYEILDTLALNIVNGVKRLLSAGVKIITDLASKLKAEVTTRVPEIGKQIVSGLINGIKAGGTQLKGFLKNWADGIVKQTKEFFGIHSPSVVFREQVGRMLGLGMKQGLESTEDLLIDTVETIGERLIDASLSTQEKLRLIELEQAKERTDSMRAYGIENIDALYNAFLEEEEAEIQKKQARLEEIELELQNSKNQKKLLAEQETLQNDIGLLEQFKSNYSATYEDMVSAYQKAYDTIMDKQSQLEEKLQAFGALYETMVDSEGNVTGDIKLADLQGQIDTITAYGNSLEALKAKGSVTQEFLDEILAMSVDDGLKYMQLLLDQTDEDFENYINLWKEKQKKSKEIAQKYYKDQFDILKRDFTDKIQKQMGLLPDQARKIGLDTAESLARGIRNNSGQVFSAIDAIISKLEEMEAAANAAQRAAEEAAGAQSDYAAASSYSVTHNSSTVNQSVSFYSNTPTPAETYRAVKQAGQELANL